MTTVSNDKKMLVDYGVQIRFIKDLDDTGGGFSDRYKTNGPGPASNKYGVAVRVQGISGHPYVVLKDGDKGDSYGVQLNTPTSSSGSPSPFNSLTKPTKASAEFTNPYGPAANTARSPVSPAEEEIGEIFGSPLKRPPGDGQAGTQGEEEVRAGREAKVEKEKVAPQLKATPAKVENGKDWTKKDEYNEAGLRPVKLNGIGPKGFKPSTSGVNSSLGRYGGTKSFLKSFSEAAASADEEQTPAINTKCLSPINKLINKFDGGTSNAAPQTRGRSGARQRLRFDERKRSRSLDAGRDPQQEVPLPPPPAVNPYAPLSTSSTSSSGSLGRISASATKISAPQAPKSNFTSQETFVTKNFSLPVAKKPEPPLRNKSMEVINGEEFHVRTPFLNTSKDSSESEGFLRRKFSSENAVPGSFKKGGSDGSLPKSKPEELQEQLQRCKRDLLQAHDELAQERMARELAESRQRLQEDQLAELQEELRRFSESTPHSDSLQTDVMTLQAELAEAALLRQRQEDTLHQRERELTALKGALKEEVECHDKEMEALREQYSQDMDNLRRTMEQFTQSQEQIVEERERVNTTMLTLEEELETCREERDQWKTEVDVTAQELHDARQELLKSHLEREEFERKIKDLEDSLVVMKKQVPASDDNHSLAEELQRCHDNLKRTRADLDKQSGELQEKSKALEALKKASGAKEAELVSEINRLKEQSQRDKAELEKALGKAREAQQQESQTSAESTGKTVVDQGKSLELQEANARLRERLARMTRLHSSVPRSSDTDEVVEALEDENRSLKSQLEEAKRGVSRLTKERDELTRRLEERDLEREALRRGKSELEEQKRLLDRALEKISKEMEMMMEESRQSVSSLHTQLDDFRERSRKELLEAQRNSKDRLAELQRAQSNLKVQQDEVSRLKKELLTCSEERDSAQLERDLFTNRLKHLESEMEMEKNNHTDRSREIRVLEDKIKTLEIELDEERTGVELLNDRIARNRDQVDQLRSDLMQERSARHDLEMDKSALERQVKELKSRMADMEGQPRPTAGLTLLENKIQELEERLRSEEREKASIQASHRRNERKLKELNATLDQERSQHVEQRDQLSLRVKALKRQVDESELEVERLEGVRRKVLRDLEEQQELQEALQAKVTALESELKRKSQHTHRSALGSSNLSSEDEDSFYDSSISSLLHESHLQTSSS